MKLSVFSIAFGLPPRGYLVGLAMAVSMFAAPHAKAGEDITGVWFDDSGRGAVELHKCGSEICGRIYWLKVTTSASGQPLRDRYNPNTSNRERPICGLTVIGGLKAQADGSWDEGQIYDPKVGRSYNVAIERAGRDRLLLTGYLGAKFLGKSFYWQRAPDTLQKCDI